VGIEGDPVDDGGDDWLAIALHYVGYEPGARAQVARQAP
jgi:hypothetical protein